MALDPTIIFRATPQQVFDPAEAAYKAARLKDLMLSVQERESGVRRSQERANFDRQFWGSPPAQAQEQQPARSTLASLAAQPGASESPFRISGPAANSAGSAPQQGRLAQMATRQPDPVYSRLGDYASALAERGYVDDALKARETYDKWRQGEDVRESWSKYSDPMNKDRHAFLSEIGGKDPARALEWAKDLADFDQSIAKADREGLIRGRDVLRELGQVLSSATDQASYDQALSWADEMGLDRSTIPEQYDPETVDQLRRYNLTAAQQLEQVWKARRFNADQNERAIDNARADGRARTLASQGERRISEVTPGKVTGPILAKMARGEPLTPYEKQTLEYAKPTDPFQALIRQRMGSGAGGPMLDANGNEPNPFGPNDQPTPTLAPKALAPRGGTPPASARARVTPPRPAPGGRPAGARVRLPDGYTPARVVSEARAAIKAGKDPQAVRQRLADYGINPNALGR